MHPTNPAGSLASIRSRSGYQVSISPADEVVVTLNNNEVLRIKLGTDMIIKTLGTLTLDAQNIELRASQNVTVSGMQTNVKANNVLDLSAGGAATLKAGANLNLNGAAAVAVNGGTLNLTAALVSVNNGALEVT